MTAERVHVVTHPLVEHKLARLRDASTPTPAFRALVRELSVLLAVEATRSLPLADVEVQTPIARAACKRLARKEPCIVPVLRAGLGLVDGFSELLPDAPVGHVGMFRDPQTHAPHEYYAKMPSDVAERGAIIVDPMLATGGTACAAVSSLRALGVRDVALAVLVAAPVGLRAVLDADPDVEVFACAVDDHLDDRAYIVPGLGDAGDRIFGTL